jgi:hypothetical protein
MSTIIASNVSDGTLSIPTTYVTNGSAKAWVNFNGTGTIAARDSLNLSSLTDNGTGDYTVNFSSAFNATNFSNTFEGFSSPGAGGTSGLFVVELGAGATTFSRTTSSTRAVSINANGFNLNDCFSYNALVHGDLA